MPTMTDNFYEAMMFGMEKGLNGESYLMSSDDDMNQLDPPDNNYYLSQSGTYAMSSDFSYLRVITDPLIQTPIDYVHKQLEYILGRPIRLHIDARPITAREKTRSGNPYGSKYRSLSVTSSTMSMRIQRLTNKWLLDALPFAGETRYTEDADILVPAH